MLDTQAIADLMPAVIDSVQAAAQAVMAIYQQPDLPVTYKNDQSPLTAADLAANDIITASLFKLTPTIAIVSEESLKSQQIEAPAQYWLVDPLDGTKEFVAGNGEFTVNVGLIRAGQPVLGVVAVPAQNKCYFGSVGHGAFSQTGSQPKRALAVGPSLEQLQAAVSRSHLDQATGDWLASHRVTHTSAIGSSLKICYVAERQIDIYPRLGPQHEWDIAAADAVLRAAGGVITDLTTGQALVYGRIAGLTPSYLAGNNLADQAALRVAL